MIKAIFEGFEITSGLRVNFSKINLIEVNFDPCFVGLTGDFHHCNQETMSFKYLGLLVRVNHRLKTNSKSPINLVSMWLNYMRHMHVILWGVILLYSILNSIMVFFLSFLNMPIKV